MGKYEGLFSSAAQFSGESTYYPEKCLFPPPALQKITFTHSVANIFKIITEKKCNKGCWKRGHRTACLLKVGAWVFFVFLWFAFVCKVLLVIREFLKTTYLGYFHWTAEKPWTFNWRKLYPGMGSHSIKKVFSCSWGWMVHCSFLCWLFQSPGGAEGRNACQGIRTSSLNSKALFEGEAAR